MSLSNNKYDHIHLDIYRIFNLDLLHAIYIKKHLWICVHMLYVKIKNMLHIVLFSNLHI